MSFSFSNRCCKILTLAISISSFAVTSSTFAAVAPHFYRSVSSPVPSGQASRSKLWASVRKTIKENWLEVQYDKSTHRIPSENAILAIHLSSTCDTALPVVLLNQPQAEAMTLASLPKGTLLKTEFQDTYWAKATTEKGITGFIPWHLLSPRREDTGLVMTVAPLVLRKSASDKAASLATVPAKRTFAIRSIQNQFAEIEFEKKIGFLNLTHLLHRSDFSHFAHVPGKGWIQYSHREKDQLIGITKEANQAPPKYPLAQHNGFFPSSDLAYIASESFQIFPPVGARVEVLKTHFVHWALSELDGHGPVYWKLNSIESQKSSTVHTTEEILSKLVFHFAFDPQNSSAAIVSTATGVYTTLNGTEWKELKDLKEQAVPVAIDSKGRFFAGSLMSTDRGETFEPYIKWDRVAEVLGTEFPFHPRNIKLQQIQLDHLGRITLQLASPSKKIKIQAGSQITEWRLIKN